MVPEVGLEPTRLAAHDFESRSSANSDTLAKLCWCQCKNHYKFWNLACQGTKPGAQACLGERKPVISIMWNCRHSLHKKEQFKFKGILLTGEEYLNKPRMRLHFWARLDSSVH